jgi:hypothetical protein
VSAHYAELAAFLGRVRRRWRALRLLHAWTWSAGTAAALLALALIAQVTLTPSGTSLVLLWAGAAIAVCACLAFLVRPLRREWPDAQVARFVEERCPDLEDGLVTAVEKGQQDTGDPVVAAIVARAQKRVQNIAPDRLIARETWRRAAAGAAAASIVCLLALALSLAPASRAARVFIANAFPQHLELQVMPGNVKVRVGAPVRIIARLAESADVIPRLVVSEDGRRREIQMTRGTDGYVAALDRVDRSFEYHVSAASIVSPEYTVTAIRPPRVQRIDLRYEFPPALHMPPRVEQDGGDIYGPAGTTVHLTIHADKPVTRAALNVAGRTSAPLHIVSGVVEGELTIADDGSYRVALSDADGLSNPGDTEYFIRTIADRPPAVRIVRPASDEQVSPLEEVTVEAKADDDHGIASLDLVYSIGGGQPVVVPFRRSGDSTSVDGLRTLYLEDLGVRPGDFVTYYAQAREVGTQRSGARSDMFFLEVRPFDAEFVGSRGQGAGAATGNSHSIEELVQAQKDVITATWRLDRRAQESGGKSRDDLSRVARAQEEVKQQAAVVASQRQRFADLQRLRGGAATQPQGATEQVAASDDPLSRATAAMDDAQRQLEALSTTDALPHEMTALNELLRAEADVRRREVQRQVASNGSGGGFNNRPQQDLSSLFDRELARQETNYETPQSTASENQDKKRDDALDRIRDLARRQEALNREQDRLAQEREHLPDDEVKRQLDRLTREESELRQQAEALAQQLASGSSGRGQQDAPGPRSSGQQGAAREQDRQDARALQQASQDMQRAASDLRRQDPGQASASGARALEQLRGLEQKRGGNGASNPDDRKRGMGDMQVKARELADRLARARELRQRLADVDRQLSEANSSGAGREGGRPSTSRPGRAGTAAPGTSADWTEAEQLLDELRRERIPIDPGDVEGFHPGKSAPGTEPWKQDYSKWDQLKQHAAVALEQLERGTAAQLRVQRSKDRLNAGSTQAVPEQYRELVDRYYRALASGQTVNGTEAKSDGAAK